MICTSKSPIYRFMHYFIDLSEFNKKHVTVTSMEDVHAQEKKTVNSERFRSLNTFDEGRLIVRPLAEHPLINSMKPGGLFFPSSN